VHETTAERISIRAPDGVEIVGARSGAGSPLALVYGAMMEQTGWARLLPHLQGEHTVYTYDRRGRGESGDAEAYEVEREVDDLLAFAGALPQPLDLFAHSSGALLTLAAAERGLRARRMVLYEPPLAAVREPQLSLETPDRIDALVRAGELDAALDLFMRGGMALSAEDVARLRQGPRWQEQMGYVQTGAYDVRVTRGYTLRPERLATIQIPALLLAGSTSPEWMKQGVKEFASALPNSRLEIIEGQGHNAQFSAPDLLAAPILRFLAQDP
jgi:pimeloyl-ACP methyl ester carboxylesterase